MIFDDCPVYHCNIMKNEKTNNEMSFYVDWYHFMENFVMESCLEFLGRRFPISILPACNFPFY